MKISRKRFLQVSLGTVAAGSALGFLQGCGDDDEDAEVIIDTPDGSTVVSCDAALGVVDDHTHELIVPSGDLGDDERTYTTSVVDGHSHEVIVTAAMFDDLAAGDTVEFDTELADGHVHPVSVTCV